MGWNELLSKYFIPPPGGYTTNYLFEIDPPGNVEAIRKVVLADLFGPTVTTIFEASLSSILSRSYQRTS
ncbi:hypothetical protein L914_15987 [Phytophthora nicotianae]|uniref:Uncharacterized protein n=1 Tax=Phytophthora nicotianae TaxID=4792 RepID=W2MM74_PHYNI|nr:hypothetical protein L914_15987 [Phytophthora nicotianae]